MKAVELLKKLGVDPDDGKLEILQGFITESLSANSAKMIPKERFDEVIADKNSYKAQLAEKETALSALNAKLEELSKTDVEGLKKENDLYKQKITDIKKSEWEKAKTVIDKNPDKFEKVKKYFKLPEKAEDYNVDVYEHNVKEFEKFNIAGYFAEEKPMTSTTPGRTQLGEPKYYDPFKLPK